MKFQIISQGAVVWIQIGDGDDKWVQFSCNIGSDFAATAVRERIDNAMRDRIKAIRRAAYAEGWADAKAKRAKKKNFYGCINGEPKYVGY